MTDRIRGKVTMMNILKENSSDRRKKTHSSVVLDIEIKKFLNLQEAINNYFE